MSFSTRTLPHSTFLCFVFLGTCCLTGCKGCGTEPPPPPPADPDLQIVHFERDGSFNPKEIEDLKNLMKEHKTTDVFLLSHGWNTSEVDARTSYSKMRKQVLAVTKENEKDLPKEYRPLVVGLVWPSKAWDRDPDTEAAITPEEIGVLKESLKGAKKESAVDNTEINKDLARIVSIIQKKPQRGTPEWKEAIILFRKYAIDRTDFQNKSPDHESIFDPAVKEDANANTELELRFPSVYDAARIFTFWQMKKRAGIVGEKGASKLLNELQKQSSSARFHLFGHSFGCKLLVSAILNNSKLAESRPVDTLILLQAAISHESFADEVTGTDPPREGGYKAVLGLVKGPIMATYTKHDLPLRGAYPLGSWIAGQTGELEAVSRFSALGAVGIFGVQSTQKMPMKKNKESYDVSNNTNQVFSLDSSAVIKGHGDYEDKEEIGWLIWAAVFRK